MNNQELLQFKAKLRYTLKERRKALSAEKRKLESESICIHLLQLLHRLDISSSKDYLALYQAMKYEVSLNYLLKTNLVYNFSVPIVLAPRHMEFLEVRTETLLAPKESQPDFLSKPANKSVIPKEFRQLDASEISALILPGLGFDRKGGRLGYGGGFYDTYLSKHAKELTSTPKIALAFDEQILDNIPKGAHDRPVDYIVTPSGIITITF